MARFVSKWALAGFCIPFVIIIVGELQGGIFEWPTLGLVLWPSWMMMLATYGSEWTLNAIEILIVSVLVNMALYSAIGAFVWFVFCKEE